MSWHTVDIGEEEYPGQAMERWPGPAEETTGEYVVPEPVRPPPAEPWPFYGHCTPTKRDLYPTEDLALERIDTLRVWCRATGRTFLELEPQACHYTDNDRYPGTHYHLRRVK